MQYIFVIMQYICYISGLKIEKEIGIELEIRMQEIRIGNRVKIARIEVGLTQQALADKVSVTRQTIGLIESGRYNPTIRLCLMLAKVTGKSLDELFWIENLEDDENEI